MLRNKYFFSSALLILYFALPSWAYAQSASVTGVVSDSESSLPLFGANVVHVGSGQGTATDANGQYTLSELPAGVSLIRVSYIGYRSTEIEVNLAEEENFVLNIELVGGIDLDQVQVTASRRQEKILDAPASIDVILVEDLARAVVPSTVMSLRNVTGLDIAQTGVDRNEVVLRGFNNVFSGATLVLTDYRDAGSASVNVNLHSLMPNLSVDLDRVEIVRGPGSALYGAGVDAGVVHYITKDAFSHPGATVSVSGGEHSHMNVQARVAGVLGKRVGVKVTGSYATANDFPLQSCDQSLLDAREFDRCPDPEDAVQILIDGERDTEFSKYTIAGNLDFRLGSQTTLSLNAGTAALNGTVLSGIGTIQGDNYRYLFGQARLSRGGFFAQFFVNANNTGDTYVYGGDPVVEYSRQYVTQAQYDMQLGTRQSLIMGFDLELTRPDTRGTVLGRNEDHDNIDEYGLYAQSTTNFTNRTELILALRGDYNNVVDKFQLSPRVGLVVKPTPNSSFRATYNRSFSSPTASSNWLDLVAATIPGTDIKVRGRGAATGFTYMRNPEYLNLGASTDLVASSLLPGAEGAPTPVGISTGLVYGLMYQSLAATPDEDIAALLAANGLNVPVPLIAALKAALSPEATVVQGFSPGVLGALNLSTAEINLGVTDVENVGPLEQTISQAFEVGYKGILGDNVLFAVDAYYATKKNFVGALQVRTPFVLVPTLPQDLVRDISTGISNNTTLAATLGLFGLSAEQAAQLLVDVAGGSLPTAETPIAIVQPNENNPGIGQVPEMMLSYPNFGDISYYGMDVSLQVIVSHALSLFGNMSWVSDDFFDHTELNEELEDKVLALNAPSFKFKLGGQYEHRSGFSVNASGRYVKGFPVVSGPYIGDVPSYFVLDIGAGYEINSVLRADIGINNATNSNHREFVGSPRLGRLASARLTYTADWR
ncbi:MAG: TonB-dependent receptor plug domain-containing protein [Rhodothermaceae bacterium]|nr:TonB-dependent receptor plug domain-containing protein [Rhodothermaceae bacterium]MYC03386.1 TonB-dependent receptor plug domain-containing protein [Rhodothermaceae bacterium]MYI16276.1 TonB-dependent receptor plug domain-containing protein [Rhodothermaceae bacterium]